MESTETVFSNGQSVRIEDSVWRSCSFNWSHTHTSLVERKKMSTNSLKRREKTFLPGMNRPLNVKPQSLAHPYWWYYFNNICNMHCCRCVCVWSVNMQRETNFWLRVKAHIDAKTKQRNTIFFSARRRRKKQRILEKTRRRHNNKLKRNKSNAKSAIFNVHTHTRTHDVIDVVTPFCFRSLLSLISFPFSLRFTEIFRVPLNVTREVWYERMIAAVLYDTVAKTCKTIKTERQRKSKHRIIYFKINNLNFFSLHCTCLLLKNIRGSKASKQSQRSPMTSFLANNLLPFVSDE